MDDEAQVRVFFDFDGTLAYRPGMWSQTLLDVLDQHSPAHRGSLASIRPHLQDGFPWHQPHQPHPHLNDPDRWWAHIGTLLEPAFLDAGVTPDAMDRLLRATRAHYCDASRFILYEDTIPALRRLADRGLGTTILSNHVPELHDIVTRLGLDRWIREIFSSAVTGYEKPHPEAFQRALGAADPAKCWMIGDNPTADIEGASAVGMRAVLVRHPDSRRTVSDAVDEILATQPT